MDEQRKYAILFAATILAALAARKLHEIDKPCAVPPHRSLILLGRKVFIFGFRNQCFFLHAKDDVARMRFRAPGTMRSRKEPMPALIASRAHHSILIYGLMPTEGRGPL